MFKNPFHTKNDQTVVRTIQLIKDTVPKVVMGGYTWYDVTDQGLGAEVMLLRQSGQVAHHPVVHTLIRFNL